MKKRLMGVILAIAAAAFCGAVTASAEVKQATAVYGTAKIDGQKDEIYNSVTPIVTDTLVKTYTYPDGSKATVWFVWDYSGLMVYAEVEEKTPNDKGGNAYHSDCVEVFIDENNSKSKTLDSDDAQYSVTMTGRTEVGISGSASFVSAAKQGDGMYAVEMKLPWQGKIPDDGTVIGFNASVDDEMGDGQRDNVMQWNSDSTDCWQDTSVYGELLLINGDGYEAYNGVNRDIYIEVNGRSLISAEAPPVIVDGRTLVPMRALFEAFDAVVSWEGTTKTVYAIRNGMLFEIPIGNQNVMVNKEPVTIDVPAMIINDRTMVPIRFVAEKLGLDVEFDDYKGIVYVNETV